MALLFLGRLGREMLGTLVAKKLFYLDTERMLHDYTEVSYLRSISYSLVV
jgi:hypothetical protein